MKANVKQVIADSYNWEITRITQGNKLIRIDAKKRFSSDRLSKWVSKKYFDFLCRDYGRNLKIDY